jgi:hypothetical protein
MPVNEGNAGVGARYYGDEAAVLRGVLASEDGAVYPDDYCVACVREGRGDNEQCFHKHWEITDEVAPYERRGKLN